MSGLSKPNAQKSNPDRRESTAFDDLRTLGTPSFPRREIASPFYSIVAY